MTKCKHADKYKGKRAPRCGCNTCDLVFVLIEALKEIKGGHSLDPQWTAIQALKEWDKHR